MAWKCPECDSLNNNSIITCTCGYERGVTTASPLPRTPQTAKVEDTLNCSKSGGTMKILGGIKSKDEEVPQVRPWVRFWARWIDNNLCGINIILTLTIYVPWAVGHYLNMVSSIPTVISGMLVLFVWIFFETFLLSTWGATPGKWLLGITLRDSEGKRPTFSKAFNRSLSVWWRGLGIGFPLISLFTLINAHGELTNKGITSWDREGGFVISHKKIGYLRFILTILLFIVFVLLTIFGLQSEIKSKF